MPRYNPSADFDDPGETLDEVTGTQGETSGSQILSLKKGDACQYCRKRRRRCTAEKPFCAQCRKLKRECVYDTGRPVSRVRQLEAKLAEMENLLKSVPQQDGVTASGSLVPPISQQNRPTPTPDRLVGSLPALAHPKPTADSLYNHPDNTSPDQADGGSSDATAWLNPGAVSDDHVNDSASLDVDQLMMEWFNTSSAFPQHNYTSIPGTIQPAAQLASSLSADSTLNLFDTLPPYLYDIPKNTSGPRPASTRSHSGVDSMQPSMSAEIAPVEELGSSADVSVPDVPGCSLGSSGSTLLNEPVADQALVGEWFDPADLPPIARDHLLDLFFSKMQFVGRGFHVPRFYARLTLPPSKRPHPSLLHAMNLNACKASSSPSIRALENHFLSIALKHIDEGQAKLDRCFDVVRACTLVAVYYFSAGRVHEGWLMTGRASRMCLLCGLHKIPSSEFRLEWLEQEAGNEPIALLWRPIWAISPPQDAVELGERIWAFWTVYLTDQAGAVSSRLPSCLTDEVISTPFPRPMYEYELGLASKADDQSVSSIWSPKPAPALLPHAPSTYYICLMRSMSILGRASNLIHLDPEEGWEERVRENSSTSTPSDLGGQPSLAQEGLSLPSERNRGTSRDSESSNQFSRGSTGRERGRMRSAQIRLPKAYEEIKRALMRLEGDLLPDFRTDWCAWDGMAPKWLETCTKDMFILHFSIGCSWMALLDNNSPSAPNRLAVMCARRMVCAVSRAAECAMGSESDALTIVTWWFIFRVLIRETQRLHTLNDFRSAAPIEADIEIIISAMRKCGQTMNLASDQAYVIDRIRSAAAEEGAKRTESDAAEDSEGHMTEPWWSKAS